MTLRLREAEIIGRCERRREQRLDQLGRRGVHRPDPLDGRRRRRHLAEHGAQERLDLRLQLRLRPVLGEALDQPCRLHERVVGDRGHRRVAGAAVHEDPEGRGLLLGGRAEVDDAAELEPVAGALVDRVVGADGVGVRLAEPGEAEAVADLLVGGGGEDQVAGRLEALAGERGDRDRVRGHLPLHVERAAPPDLAVAHLAGERRHRPLGGVGEDDVGVAEQQQRRAVAATRNPGDEAGALGHARVEVAANAVCLEVFAQELGRRRLVAGRVGRVDADEPAEQIGDFVPQAHVRSLRNVAAAHASGLATRLA